MKNLYFNSIVKKLKHSIVLLAILFGFSNAVDAQVRKAFTQRTSTYSPNRTIYNIKGDFTMLGNTCLTPQNYSATTNNNDATMIYVDTDSDSNTWNSSSSTLVIPSENGSVPSCSNIVFAGLYWTGKSSANTTFDVTKAFPSNQTINNNLTVGHNQSIANTTYNLAISRGGSTNITRYPIYTFTSGGTSYAFRFYNVLSIPRVTVMLNNNGTEINVPATINLAGTEATLTTPYTITNGTVTLTIKKLIRDAATNLSTNDTQSSSFADVNVAGTIIVNTNVTKSFNKRVVKLKGPLSGAYTDITAGTNDIYYPSGTDDNIFSAFAEITDYVRTNGLGQYTVADMALLEGNPGGTGYSGGWGIIVVYENSKMKWRDVTIFDGYAYVEAGNSSAGIELPVSGFNATVSGNVGMKIGVMASEGDIGYTADYFKIRNLNTANYTTLSRTTDGVIPNPDNFFRSYINAPGTRNPNLDNNTGIDIGIINIPNNNNSIIGNSQTSTKFLYGTNGDTYSIFTIAMSVDAYVPQVEGIITTATINGSPAVQPYTILPGQEAGFNVDIRNIGTEAVNNYKLIIPIPYNTTYVPGSAVGTIFSPQTTPTPNNITFNPSLGATGSIVWDFGTLVLPANPASLLARLTFKLKSTTDCAILSNTSCGSVIAVNGGSTGIGSTTNVALNNSSLIQGYTQNGSCVGEPIPTPINIAINGTAYVGANCPNQDYTRHFSYCSASTSVLPSQIASNFPLGSLFYNSFPVTINSIQYTDANPIPLVAGSTVTYYAVPSGGSTGCNFPFTITKCPVIIAQDDTIAGGNGTSGNPNVGNVLSNNGNGPDTLNNNPAQITDVNITITTPATPINGNPVPVININTGQISVPPGTPAGTYTIVYNLCEKLNPSTNCDPATVTITVTAPTIIAQNDTIIGGNGAAGNPNAGNVLSNNGNGPDTLNNNNADISLVNITVTTPATSIGGAPVPVLSTTTGQISVPVGTPAGTYTIVYNLCEKLNPTNCDPATVTITVSAATIIAQDDTMSGGNGTTGNPNIGNVLSNNGNGPDTLNNIAVTITQVNITVTTPAVSIGGAPVPTLNIATGQVFVPGGTPAGTYTIVYNLCEKLNPTNCDPATVTITVTPPVIIAQDDTMSGGNGLNGNPNAGNVLNDNGHGIDTLNGSLANIALVNITVTTPAVSIGGAPVPVLSTTTGQVSVPPGTPAGTYTIVYNLCEKLNPTNCDPATVTITVSAATIIAQDDTMPGGNGFNGNPNAGNVLSNNGNGPDTLNNIAVAITQVNISVTTPAVSIGGAPVPVLNTTTGQVSVPAGTPAGTYTIVYNLCEKLNPTNCDPATVTITVNPPAIIAQDDTMSGGNGTTGNPNAGNVLSNNGNGPDTLNNNPVNITQVNITVTTPAVSIGGAPVPVLDILTGQVSVPAGTAAGTYTIVYNLCEKLNPTNCDPATVTIVCTPPVIDAVNDTYQNIVCPTTGTIANILTNDLLNGAAATLSNVNLTILTGTFPSVSIDNSGNVILLPGASCGDYTFTYRICEKLNPTNCDTATVTISIQDNTAPTWTTAAGALNATVECSNAAALAAAQAQFPVASDACDTDVTNIVKVAGQFVASAGCANAGSYTNTWTVTDACGNVSATFTQVITVQDTTAPTWTTAAGSLNATVECSDAAAIAAAQAQFPVASDLCDSDVTNIVKVAGQFVASAGCANAGSYTNTWTVTDACGNVSATFTQVINVQDTTAPTWTTAAGSLNATVECSDAAALAAAQAQFPVAADACDTDVTNIVKVSGQFVASANCANAGSYTNTWTVTDACGNVSATFTQVITVQDTTAPTWTTTAGSLNATVECSDAAAIAAAQAQFPIASDLCDADVTNIVKVAGQFVASANCANAGSYTNTWTVTDACGNVSATFTQVINVQDTTAPTWTTTAGSLNATVECSDAAALAAAQAQFP
ncbi:beta strand repeat-containing protein, partial [Flavobacterium wongokense]|uniref:beta strand repeat-containing protein n=1 Tax=Flavobacterium wongokense TaxID=2910674 RepID=UPI001F35AA09